MRHQDSRILWYYGAPLEWALSAGAAITTTAMTTKKTSRRAAGVM